MLSLLRRLVNQSVFKRIPTDTAMNDILAVLFHRSAATLYLIYTLWAVIAMAFGIPSVVAGIGDLGQLLFSVLVLCTAAPACYGATFWPNRARLELFAGSSFCAGILIYLFFLLINALFNGGSWAGFTIIWSILVIPAARTVIIVILLLRQAAKSAEAREAAQ